MNPGNYAVPVLLMYCEWLNMWMEAEDSNHRYDIHNFTVYDPQLREYGKTEVHAVVPTGGGFLPRFIVILTCSDGDEGGPATLTTWFEVAEDNTTSIIHMIQEFDLNIQTIYDQEKGFLNTP